MKSCSPAQITARILKKSEDFFGEGGDAEDLRVAVRVSCDFRDFVKSTVSSPIRTTLIM